MFRLPSMAFLAVLLSLIGTIADAAPILISTNAGYTGPGLNLAAFANGNYNFTFGPIAVDGYTFTGAPGGGGNSGLGSVVGQGAYNLASNGSFGGSATYIGVDSATGFAQLVLNGGPVSQLGFYMNYAPGVGNNATIWALDINGNPFASFDLTALAPISTPAAFNAFQFRGISDTSNSIYGLRFGGNYQLVTGTPNGALPVATVVPEPASIALWGLVSLAGAGAGWYRRRTKVATA